MNQLLYKKNAIITGARRGIGRATVEIFAEQGANIWACARRQDDAFEADMETIAKKYGIIIWPTYFDMIDEGQIKEAVIAIRKQNVSVDVLVNVAGIAEESTSFQMTSLNKVQHVMNVNFFSVSLLTQYVSRLMARQNSGSIINTSSIAGIDGTPGQFEYVASKAAIIGATKSLARELSVNGIRVNAVAPGIISTDMGLQINERLKQEVLCKTIMKRIGKPEEIANTIAFLASDMASYITGQVIRVDGGI